MSRSFNGFVPVDREVIGALWRCDHHVLGVYLRLLTLASYKPTKIVWEGGTVELKPGQLITTLRELAASNKSAEISLIRRVLDTLHKRHIIQQAIGTHGRIITICNLNEIVPHEITSDTPNDNEATTDRHANDTIRIKNKNNKNNTVVAVATQQEGTGRKSKEPKKAKAAEPTEGSELWRYYAEKLLAARKITAVKTGAKEAKWCKSLCSQFGLTKAQSMVDAFIATDSSFNRDRGWNLGTLMTDLQKYANSGSKPKAWSSLDVEFDNQFALDVPVNSEAG